MGIFNIGWQRSAKEVVQDINDEKKKPTARVADNTGSVHIQFNGWAIVLLKDGHFFFEDTSGG